MCVSNRDFCFHVLRDVGEPVENTRRVLGLKGRNTAYRISAMVSQFQIKIVRCFIKNSKETVRLFQHVQLL